VNPVRLNYSNHYLGTGPSHVVISTAERGIKQENIGHCAVLADQAREEIRQWFERIVFNFSVLPTPLGREPSGAAM